MASTSMIKNKGEVVDEPNKEHGMWIFANTECRVDKNVTYTWILYSKHSSTKTF